MLGPRLTAASSRERWRPRPCPANSARPRFLVILALAAQLRGNPTEREAAFAELLRLEAAHQTTCGPATHAPVAIHVGGLEGELEDEGALASLFGRFGTVLAATLRVRREVKNGKQVVSWALVSFGSAAEAQAAIDASADLSAHYAGLVMRTVDEAQVAQSPGAMGDVMRIGCRDTAPCARSGSSNNERTGFYSRSRHLGATVAVEAPFPIEAPLASFRRLSHS